MKKWLMICGLLLAALPVRAEREVYDLNGGWMFYTYDQADSVSVELPHTWNDVDALAGRADYYRGAGQYVKSIYVPTQWQGRRVFIRFYGANTVADLLVNGRYAGQHRGGNNAFEFELTDLLNYGERNLLWVTVSNAFRTDVLPTSEAENVYGGLYRRAEIEVTGPTVIGFDGWGDLGVRMQPRKVNAGQASGQALVAVNALHNATCQIGVTIRDDRDSVVWRTVERHKVDEGVSEVAVPFTVEHPRLWQGTEDPYLYRVMVSLADGERVDSVSFRTGFRTFAVDAEKGFSLNGQPYPLRGVVLWRDQAVYGPVFTESQLRRDVALIREMGANAVRVAGGSHAREFYDLCDEAGLVVLTDGPLIGTTRLDRRGYYNAEAFRANGLRQLQEAIRQLGNHPSICFWGLFADPKMIGDDPRPFIEALQAEARRLDPSRLTAGVSNQDGDVNTLTDLIVWNHSFGWTLGQPEDIAIWRDQLHSDPVWKRMKSAVSYRAGGSPYQYADRLQWPDPSRSWHPENWQSHVHEVHYEALAADSTFWALFVGDMFDRGDADSGTNGSRGIDDCGLVSFDRRVRKDAFWFYKANWNKSEPFVRFAGRRHGRREGAVQSITVYSNLPVAELFVNGESLGTQVARNGVMTWENVQLRTGNNQLSAFSVISQGDDYVTLEDHMTLLYVPYRVL
ncbi:MAG TPA: glycoside hydrolase family 2 protein [Candidatus Tidjanibacter faecipullorum]|uniref:Glycoside hydrolase family 2 protein n=1 Tax=Candidatus Tidjanibacter faecipullorum TaxID=2838766 RepID=A0A9D2DEK4_9BACT|nr:glycoside hydrolase family 2 protein [Candidatus Tidjanibacter faecipullorum]